MSIIRISKPRIDPTLLRVGFSTGHGTYDYFSAMLKRVVVEIDSGGAQCARDEAVSGPAVYPLKLLYGDSKVFTASEVARIDEALRVLKVVWPTLRAAAEKMARAEMEVEER